MSYDPAIIADGIHDNIVDAIGTANYVAIRLEGEAVVEAEMFSTNESVTIPDLEPVCIVIPVANMLEKSGRPNMEKCEAVANALIALASM